MGGIFFFFSNKVGRGKGLNFCMCGTPLQAKSWGGGEGGWGGGGTSKRIGKAETIGTKLEVLSAGATCKATFSPATG